MYQLSPKTISIHALLAESDSGTYSCSICSSISIHALLAESDITAGAGTMILPNFYPRSPCGERLDDRVALIPHQQISIHALLAESDRQTLRLLQGSAISIHALLAESDSLILPPEETSSVISIHALLAESDCGHFAGVSTYRYFYPRSPCGERLPNNFFFRLFIYFYPRSPCGERHIIGYTVNFHSNFYPRSPCGERLFERHKRRTK